MDNDEKVWNYFKNLSVMLLFKYVDEDKSFE